MTDQVNQQINRPPRECSKESYTYNNSGVAAKKWKPSVQQKAVIHTENPTKVNANKIQSSKVFLEELKSYGMVNSLSSSAYTIEPTL